MRRSALLLVVLALTGCMSDGTTTTVAPPEPGQSADFGVAMRFVNANAARARQGWARSAITTAARFASIVGTDAETTTITMPSPEIGNRAEVTITQEGLLDDSVRAIRYDLVLRRRPDGTWRIFSVERTQRCWAGRGHEQFSAAPCV